MTEPCARWSGDLAALALGALPPEQRVAAVAHVDGCAACAQALADLRTSVAVLDRADPDRIDALTPAPRGLDARVLEAVEQQVTGTRRRALAARWGLAAAAAVLVVAGTGALLAAREPAPTPAGEVVALGAASGVVAPPAVIATLTAKPWGTAVELVVTGSDPGTVYRVWVADLEGARTSAGTFIGADRTLTVPVAAALARSDTAAIGVSTDTGDPLLVADLATTDPD